MKFEELESVWALQQPAKMDAIDGAALRRALKSQLNLRRRLLILGGAGLVLGLILMQALFFLNLRVTEVETQWFSFARLMLHQGLSLLLVFVLVRIFIRNRRLARGRAESLRDVVSLSLASAGAEMADYRLGRWAIPLLLAQSIVSLYLNELVMRLGWDAFAHRVGLMAAIYGLIGVLVWRHYRGKLQPERDRLRATLAELEKTRE